MDKELEEFGCLGFIGICGVAYTLLVSWRRLFCLIAITLVLPLAFVLLAHIHIFPLFLSKMEFNSSAYWAAIILFEATYHVIILILSLLSTAAVVYVIASVYTFKDVSFHKILYVVPKVWKRLMVTFLYAFLLLSTYNIVIILILTAILLLGRGRNVIAVELFIVFVYLVGVIYISIVWHVASVVSVLEDVRGIAAMKKSRELVRGKFGVTTTVFIVLNVAFIGIEMGYLELVVGGKGDGWITRATWATLMVVLLVLVVLVGLVVQTVIYFVCKSYHLESIDKSSLADHLEVYVAECMPLKGMELQLRQFYV